MPIPDHSTNPRRNRYGRCRHRTGAESRDSEHLAMHRRSARALPPHRAPNYLFSQRNSRLVGQPPRGGLTHGTDRPKQ